jgi:hypothetical protein
MTAWPRSPLLFRILIVLWGVGLGMVVPLGIDIYRESVSLIARSTTPVQLTGPCDFTMLWAAGGMANAGQAADIYTPQKIVAREGAIPQNGHAWRREGTDPIARMMLTACLGLLMTPYGYIYDLSVTSIAVAALAFQERRLVLEDVLLFGWPVLGLVIALKFYVELAPVILCLAAWRAARALGPKPARAGLIPQGF